MVVVDCEANGLIDEADTVWCVVAKRLGQDWWVEWKQGDSIDTFRKYVENCPIIGHNYLTYDQPLLEKLWGIGRPPAIYDTLTMSRLYWPDRPSGHSLENWGKILGFEKGEFAKEEGAFDQWDPRMVEYCVRDVELTEKVFHTLNEEMGII